MSEEHRRSKLPPWLAPIAAIVGPAAIMTAGIMGPGSTTSLVLAGAWFRYDLLWIAMISLPAIVVCLDSGARVGIMSGGKGMLAVIRDEIHPAVTWFVLVVMVLFNVFVNMGMFSVMSASFLSIFGHYPPEGTAASGYTTAQAVLSLVFAAAVLSVLLTGNYKRVQKVMTGLLFFVFICFFVVALRGLKDMGAIAMGLIPSIPEDLAVAGTEVKRQTYSSIVAIAGGGLAAAPILSFSYFTSDDKARPEDMPRYFWKSVFTLGLMFGLYSTFVLVAGGFALHTLPNHASIQTVHEAGKVLTRAFPAALSVLAPKVFAVGLFTCGLNTLVVVSQLMCYFCLDAFRQDWHYTRENSKFRWLLVFWVGVPAVLSTFWKFPPLLKMVLLMGLNIVIVPMAIIIMIYLINKRSLMGDRRANVWRNAFLAGSLCLALWLAASKAPGYVQGAMKQLRSSRAAQATAIEPRLPTSLPQPLRLVDGAGKERRLV